MNHYKTNDVAKLIGIHVNTVRLYEQCGLIPKPERSGNGYRVFTDLHIEQFRLARAALRTEVLQNGLRKQAVDIVKLSALGDYKSARQRAGRYLQQIDLEVRHAEEAIDIAGQILHGSPPHFLKEDAGYTRKEAAELLQISTDTLRNWELNGLITVKRRQNQYRVYHLEDMQRLKMIRSLRCANYSLTAILRMLQALDTNPSADIRENIDTPAPDEDVISACDKLLTSLSDAKRNMKYVLDQIKKLERMEQIEQIKN